MEDPSQPPFTQTLMSASPPQTSLLGPGARATWGEDMELALVEALVLEVQMGKRAENGFKRESFVRMQTAVNLKNYRKLLDVQLVKTKYHLVSTWPTRCRPQLGTEILIGHRSRRSSIALLNLSIIAASDGMMSEVCQQQILMYGTAF